MHITIYRILFFCILDFLAPVSLCAQKLFGNEWIIPSNSYLRIPVVQTGFYKISTQELVNAGFPIDSGSVAGYQMFRRGKELAIEVIHNQTNTGAEIKFYGERNDGALDTALYVTPDAIPHTHYSLYSDTSAYFLTWQKGVIGKRISNKDTIPASDSIDYHFEAIEKLFISHYAPGNFYPPESGFNDGSALTTYDYGEGWTGPEIKENESSRFSFELDKADVERFGQAEVEMVVVGRSAGEHALELWTHGQAGLKKMLHAVKLEDFNSITFKIQLSGEDLKTNKLEFELLSNASKGSVSVSYIKIKYPQKGAKRVFNSMPILKPRLVKFSNIKPDKVDYLILTHPAVREKVNGADPVEAYAAYRASSAGGNYKPLIIESEAVFDQFNYGEPGPSGLKNLISWFAQAGHLKFVFLIGRSIDPQKARKSQDARITDLVPNAGWPGSDIALVMGHDSASGLNPIVAIGRLNALNAQQVADYLNKVKAMEGEPADAPWRKNILHLSGGRSPEELSTFLDYVKSFEQKIDHAALSANVETISKKTTDAVERLPLHIPINKGVGLITLFGHSSLDVTDIDIGLASDPQAQIQNHPRYPAIIVNGCAAGSIFYSNRALSNDWILSPNNGAILFLAHTFNGLSTDLKHYTESFYEVLADSSFTNQPFGIIQNEAIHRNLTKHKNISAIITAQQMVLHGDPAIRIFPKNTTLQAGNNEPASSGIRAINVFPNPSKHLFHFFVEFESLETPKNVNLFVYDLWGRKVNESTFKADSRKNEWLWNPENLSTSVYLYRLEIDDGKTPISPAAEKALQGRLIWLH
ncbi:C25 family cysteine peptidase [Dyadobacter sp. CY326]|uniref:putative type IX secretion system sortase PorU2 n=1 Tax=Dyadobacter sp. CY326 TaxID=2907300 RepID=UPI001F2D9BF0|nr:C25 family cysteine peptidase [Dyadobacter sp. CY326]MCE7067482.1 C25 family cysteine peptidase [Dyadobacter sp. CY326]